MPLTAFGPSMRRAFALLAVLIPHICHAYVLKRDSSGSVIRWTRPVQFVVDSNLDQALGEPRATAAIQAALNAWSVAAPTVPMSLAPGQVEGLGYDHSDQARNKNEIFGLSKWPFDENAIAVTLVTTDTGSHEILDADIALNTSRHTFRVLPIPHTQNNFDDIENTVTHELGHALGLAHNSTDPSVVMYPSARLGETSKRNLALDDQEGIGELYPPGGPRITGSGGCAASPGNSSAGFAGLLIAAVFWLRLRRRRLCAVPTPRRRQVWLAMLLLPTLARAYQTERADAPVQGAVLVATAEVVSTRLQPESENSRVLMTEVELSVRTCIKGTCPAHVVVLVMGGRTGKIEQFIDGEPVPELGAVLGITVAPGSSLDAPTAQQARVYRLALARDFLAFARGLQGAGLSTTLPLPGSAAPSR